LRHDHQKSRYVREYEAEMWAHEALQRHGVAIPENTTANAMENVFFAIDDANKRGQFGRWNLWLELEADRIKQETETAVDEQIADEIRRKSEPPLPREGTT
jgi:hypothetical protein